MNDARMKRMGNTAIQTITHWSVPSVASARILLMFVSIVLSSILPVALNWTWSEICLARRSMPRAMRATVSIALTIDEPIFAMKGRTAKMMPSSRLPVLMSLYSMVFETEMVST